MLTSIPAAKASILSPETTASSSTYAELYNLLYQQEQLWAWIAAGLIALGTYGIVVIFASLFLQQRQHAVRFFNQSGLLVAAAALSYVFVGTKLHNALPFIEVDLLTPTTAVLATQLSVIISVSILTYLPVAHRLSSSATVILGLAIGTLIYPVYYELTHTLTTNLTLAGNSMTVGAMELGSDILFFTLAATMAFAGIFVSGRNNTPVLPEYVLLNTQHHNLVQVRATAAMIGMGAIGFAIGLSDVRSGELSNAISNVMLVIALCVFANIIMRKYVRSPNLFPILGLGMTASLTTILGNASHVTPLATLVFAAISATLSLIIASIRYQKYRDHSILIFYVTIALSTAIGFMGYPWALHEQHVLPAITQEYVLLQIKTYLIVAALGFGSGYALFSLFKILNQFKELNKEDIRFSQLPDATSQMEHLLNRMVWQDGTINERLTIQDSDPYGKLGSLFNAHLDKLQDHTGTEVGEGEAQQANVQRLATFAEGAFEGLAISANGTLIECNHVILELLGYSAEEMRGKELFSFIAPDMRERAQKHVSTQPLEPQESIVLSKSGERIPVETRGRVMTIGDDVLRVTAMRDLRAQKAAEAEMLRLAKHDNLTDLPNRTLFNERFEELLSRQKRNSDTLSAIILLDLDRFKDINDLYGHPVGDKLIQQVAQRLRACVSQLDTVARLGGDEFAILQVGIKTKTEVALLVSAIQDAINNPIYIGNSLTIRTSFSIGIALIPENGTDAVDLMSKADIALYEAKEAGRNGFAFFRSEMEDKILLRRTMEGELKNALMNEELQLFFQPQARSDTRDIVGFEALLRWNHPTKGMISPADFIPIAEESGLIIPIGRWVLYEACCQAAKWPEKYRVGVNLSPVQFCDEYLIEEVESALGRSGLAPHRLELEVTESVLIHDDRRALSVLSQLKQLGVKIALDDFGTGYSSLSYLRRFPFDRLKIDRSFVSGVTQTPELAAIIRAVIDLGQALGMEVIAEGVETEPELELLRQESCDEVQGFLIGRPQALTAEEISDSVSLNARIQALDQYIEVLQSTSEELKRSEQAMLELDQEKQPVAVEASA